MDDAIYKYLKSQMSNTVFGDKLKIDDPDCVVKDTVIFGRPAYIITKEQTEKNIAAEVYGKTIVWRDKENGLPYYKYGLVNPEPHTRNLFLNLTGELSWHTPYSFPCLSEDSPTSDLYMPRSSR